MNVLKHLLRNLICTVLGVVNRSYLSVMFHVEQIKKGRRLLPDLFANLFIGTKIVLNR